MNITIDDFNLYCEKLGTGKKEILILPGWGDTRKTFNYMIECLKKKYTIYIIDYPGFGNSPFPKKDLTVYDYAKLITNFLEHLEIKHPIIIAHSFGARIAIILETLMNIKIEKLIIMGGAGIKPKKKISKTIKQYTYKLLKKLTNILPKKARKKYLNILINIFGSKDYKSISNNMKKTFSNIVNEDLTPLLKQIETETLLIWGEKDKDTPLKDGITMNKLIKNSGLITIKNGTHFIYLNMPHYINTIILEFLK